MGLQEQQNFLAKLYVDEKFRKEFIAKPDTFGKSNGLNDNEIEDLIAILPGEIEAFAESLVFKRLREVEKMLPQTREILKGEFERNFSHFAGTFVPRSVKKHLEDAFEYCGYLLENMPISDEANDVISLEQAKLEFYGYRKNFVVRRVNSTSESGKKSSKSLRLWVRFRNKEFIR